MLSEFVLSLDFLAAVATLCYIAKLLFFRDSAISLHNLSFEKRSLLNQHVFPRA